MLYQKFRFNPRADESRAALARIDERRDHALPLGFPFYFDVDRGLLHKPSLHLLASKASLPVWKAGGPYAADTVETYADDLKPWLDFCSELDLRDDEIDGDHGAEYAEHLLERRIARTGEALAPNTRRQRLDRAGAMLDLSTDRGWSDCRWDMAGLRAILSAYGSNALGPKGPRSLRARHRSFMLVEEYEEVCMHLGPLPSEREAGATRSARPRLTSEAAATTGMRAVETAGLETGHFTGFDIPDGEGWLPIHITETKNKTPRDILMPFSTAREMRGYLVGEREASVSSGRGRADHVPSARLFVNDPASIRGRGNPVTPGTISADFRDAVVKADFVFEVPVVGREGPRVVKVPTFHYHGLRHSFAMWLYALLAVDPNDPSDGLRAEPWVRVAARLGHADPATAQQYYIRLSGALEVQVSELVRGARRMMIHG